MDRMTIVQRGTRVFQDMAESVHVEFPTTGSDIEDHEYAVRCVKEFLDRREGVTDSLPAVRLFVSYQGMVEYVEVQPTPVLSELAN